MSLKRYVKTVNISVRLTLIFTVLTGGFESPKTGMLVYTVVRAKRAHEFYTEYSSLLIKL